MKKSKYLVLNSFYFDFNDDLTEITNVKELFKKQNILDLHRFDILKNIERFAFKENQIKQLKLPQTIENINNFVFENNQIKQLRLTKNIKIIDAYAFESNKIKILDLSNCVKLKKIKWCAFSINPLKEIKILGNIEIEYEDYYKKDMWNEFVIYYNDNNKKAGNYKLENNEWKWYPL